MIRYWLALLLAFFRPAIEGEGAEGEGSGEGAGDGAGEGEGSGDGDGGEGSGEGEGEGSSEGEGGGAKAAAQEEAERRATADRDRADRLERENTELRMRNNPPPDQDADLRTVLANPSATVQEKWKAEADLVLRQNTRVSQQALFQSHDNNDKAAFESLMSRKPTAAKYKDRVEKALVEMRGKGQNASREAIYKYMLGEDTDKALEKRGAAKPAASTVNRGKTPGARSDVSGKGGGLTEHQKRTKRLENVQI